MVPSSRLVNHSDSTHLSSAKRGGLDKVRHIETAKVLEVSLIVVITRP